MTARDLFSSLILTAAIVAVLYLPLALAMGARS